MIFIPFFLKKINRVGQSSPSAREDAVRLIFCRLYDKIKEI